MQNSAWTDCTLGDVIELKRGYDLPQQDRRDGPYPIVSSSGISGWHDEPKAKAPGVVTGRYGTIGQVYFIDRDFWPLNTTLYIRDFKGNDPRFISYFLRSVDFLAYSDKAAVPGLNRNHLHQARVRLPALKIQKQIAEVLGTLDKKIELSQKQNQTLEQMARTIFKSWFIDFDPVHAKSQSKKPFGMDDATAALFSSSFEKSEMGEIPKGWKVLPVYDIADWQNGMTFNSSHFTESGLPIIKIAELKDKIDFGTKRTDQEHDPKFRIDDREILFSWSGSPDTSIDTFLWSHGPAWLNQHIFKVTPKEPKSFVYWLLKYLKPTFIEIARNKQTTGLGHVTVGDLKRLRYCLPSPKVLEAFEASWAPSIDLLFNNLKEDATLSTIRDLLLPRLLSDEVAVTEIL